MHAKKLRRTLFKGVFNKVLSVLQLYDSGDRLCPE